MKNQKSINRHITLALQKLILLSILVVACKKESQIVPQTECTALDIAKPYSTQTPNYNLNVYFKGATAAICGYVEFRQVADGAQFIHLDTWVHGLEPNTSYVLQRAVDTTIDGNCSSTAWLTLGKGLVAQSIDTDTKGSGQAELFRSVSTITVGTTFDIHFQILKMSTSVVVLTSDCYQYTVR